MTIQLDIEGDKASDFTSGVLSAVSNGALPCDEDSALLTAIDQGTQLEK